MNRSFSLVLALGSTFARRSCAYLPLHHLMLLMAWGECGVHDIEEVARLSLSELRIRHLEDSINTVHNPIIVSRYAVKAAYAPEQRRLHAAEATRHESRLMALAAQLNNVIIVHAMAA